MRVLCAAVLLCVVAPITAQRTIIVDANQGTGFDFTDIPPAVAAAQDGDTIVVRAGTYASVLVENKAIALLGEPGAVITEPALALSGIEIRNLAAGREFSARGFQFSGSFLLGDFVGTASEGRIVFEDLHGQRLNFNGCANACANRCSWTASGIITASTVALTECVASGALEGLASPGLRVQSDSHVTCGSCSFAGLPGLAGVFPDGAGIDVLDTSVIRLAGDATDSVQAAPNSTAAVPVSAIIGLGIVELDPDIVLTSRNGAPLIAPSVTVRSLELASLTVQAGAIGQTVTVELRGDVGEDYFLFWARRGDALPFPLLDGKLWLDPATITLGTMGTFDATATATVTYRAPRLPGLVGAPFAWQGVTGTAAGYRLTNPAAFVHLP